jgi:hypothetical protein
MARLLVDKTSGDAAWLIIIGGAVTYELLFDDLLSESADRARAKHPVMLRLVIGAIALHLTALIPAWADLFNAKNLAHRGVVRLYSVTRGYPANTSS